MSSSTSASPPAPATLGHVLGLYLKLDRSPFTNKVYARILGLMASAIGHERDLRRVTVEDILDYVGALRRRDPPLKAATLRSYVAKMRAFFSWAVETGYLEASPAATLRLRKLEAEPPEDRAMPTADMERLVAYAAHRHPRDYAIVLFLIDTGCRVGGMESLTLDHLDMAERRARLLEKGGRWVWVDFADDRTVAALEAWLTVRPKAAHRRVWTTTGVAARPLHREGIAALIKRLCRAAGCSRAWFPHSIRHAVGHAFGDVEQVSVTQHKLNHKNVQTTLNYYYRRGGSDSRAATQRHPLAPLAAPLAGSGSGLMVQPEEQAENVIPFRSA